MEAAENATAPVVVERVRQAPKPKRHRLEENPPPPIRALTVEQVEAEQPGLKGKLRDYIKRAYADDPDFAWLKLCIIRIGRSLFLDDVRLRESLYQRTALPPAAPRNPEGRTRVARRKKKAEGTAS